MRKPIDFKQYEGNDAMGFVISLNLHRRHLSEGQRATVAAKLANMVAGDNQHKVGAANLPDHGVSQAKAAEMLNVSERSVRSASKVLHSGDDELVHAVERGEVAVSAAAQIADLPKETQRAIVNEGASKGAARQAAAETPADASGSDSKRRFSATRLAAHRAKLGLSAASYGALVGVSGQTIYHWEQGKARPCSRSD